MPLPVANSTSDVLKGVPVIAAGVTVAGSVTVATANAIAKVVGLTTEKYTYSSSNVYSLSVATTAFSEILVDVRPFGIAESVVDEVGSGQDLAAEEAVGQTVIGLTAVTADDDFNSCWIDFFFMLFPAQEHPAPALSGTEPETRADRSRPGRPTPGGDGRGSRPTRPAP